MTITKLTKIMLGAAFLVGTLNFAQAQDTKVDPTGTYIWTMPGRNGGPDRTNTLTLKLDGDTLTGKLSAPGRGGKINETEIADGKVDGSTVSFNVIRTYNENTMTNKYSGKLADGTITGTIEFNRNGDTQSRDWTAKVQK